VRSPVEWVASIRRMVGNGVDTFIECGPGAALTGMVKRITPKSRTLNVSDLATLDTATAAVRALRVGTPA
jgi:[acyl-carrier-protein] S-malonyltransferase